MLADVTGKVVKELANGNYTAGTHTIEFKTNDLGSGTYIYLLETGGTRLIRQMVISK